jgi:hypothetical protein
MIRLCVLRKRGGKKVLDESVVELKGIQRWQRVAVEIEERAVSHDIPPAVLPALARNADEHRIPIQNADAVSIVHPLQIVEAFEQEILLAERRAGEKLRTIVAQLTGPAVAGVGRIAA